MERAEAGDRPAGEAAGQAGAARSRTYELGQLCGKGTFGDVYEGRCVQTGDRVAVKLVNKAFLRDKEAQTRLLREIQIQRRLDHRNVLGLLDFYEDTGFVYLVTELCEGGELLALVRRHGRLTEAQARELFRQMAQAVHYLHSQSIMHRDIKLANILLSKQESVLKICDFGLAAALESQDSERVTVCGTPNYLSPEVALNQPYSFASDLWSLGVALYTMIVGVPPFQGRQVSETLQRVKSGHFTLPAHVSSGAADLISGLLQLDPRQRLPLQAVLGHSFLHRPTSAALADHIARSSISSESDPAAAATADLSEIGGSDTSQSPLLSEQQVPVSPKGATDGTGKPVGSGAEGSSICSPDGHTTGSAGNGSQMWLGTSSPPELQPVSQSPDVPKEVTWPCTQCDSPCPEPNSIPSWARCSFASVRQAPLSPPTPTGDALASPTDSILTCEDASDPSPLCQASELPDSATRASVDVGALAAIASSQELGRCASLLCRSSIAALPATQTEQPSAGGSVESESASNSHTCNAQQVGASGRSPASGWKNRRIVSSARLLPRFHSTTYGHLAVLPDSSVQVGHAAHGVSVTVLPCGSRIRIQRQNRPDKQFRIEDMPPGVEPFYDLAVEFTWLVASATPRVVLDCPDVRAVLSETGDITLCYKETILPKVNQLRVSADRLNVQLTQSTGEHLHFQVSDLHTRETTALSHLAEGLGTTALLKAIATAVGLGEKCQRAERRALQLGSDHSKVTYPILTRSRTKRAQAIEPLRQQSLPPRFPASVMCNP